MRSISSSKSSKTLKSPWTLSQSDARWPARWSWLVTTYPQMNPGKSLLFCFLHGETGWGSDVIIPGHPRPPTTTHCARNPLPINKAGKLSQDHTHQMEAHKLKESELFKLKQHKVQYWWTLCEPRPGLGNNSITCELFEEQEDSMKQQPALLRNVALISISRVNKQPSITVWTSG